jgi:hypothetical protein
MRFVEPWFLGRRLQFELDLYHRDIQYYSDVYNQTETGRAGGFDQGASGARISLPGSVTPSRTSGLILRYGRRRPTSWCNSAPAGAVARAWCRPSISPELAQEEGDWLVSKVGFPWPTTRAGWDAAEPGTADGVSFDAGGRAVGGGCRFLQAAVADLLVFPRAVARACDRGAWVGLGLEPYGGSDFGPTSGIGFIWGARILCAGIGFGMWGRRIFWMNRSGATPFGWDRSSIAADY